MDYCFLNGLLVVLLIQHCTSEGLSTTNQSSSVVSLQDGQVLPHEPEIPDADVVPVVVPPSLKEVQQVMQEASEKMEDHGAQEVLKELLEKVAEAAMEQVGGGSEAKGHEAVTEADTKTEVLEQAGEEKDVEGEDMGAGVGHTVGKEQGAEVDTFKDVTEEGKGSVKGKGVTAAGYMAETTAGVETGDRDGVEVVHKSLDTEVSQEVVEQMLPTLENTRADLTVQGAEEEDINERVVLSKEKGAVGTEAHEATETVVKVVLGGKKDIVDESDPTLLVAGVDQIGEAGVREGAQAEEIQVDEMKGEVIILPSDSYDIETTHSVLGEVVEEDEEVNLVPVSEEPEVENKQGHVMVEAGVAGKEEVEGTNVAEAAVEERGGNSEVNDKFVNEKDDQRTREDAHVAVETSPGTDMEDQDLLVISAPVPVDGAEASVEQSPENHAPTLSPSLGEVEIGEDTLGDEKSDQGNEIITPIDDLLAHNPLVAQPTLDNFMKDVLAPHPQSEGNEPGMTNELVEDTARTTETSELGLDAWKIGAISAAVFLVVETVVIIFYILKRRNKNSTPALQRACEEGCVEPEEATGGNCSEDTLPADNGDIEQITTLDPPKVASNLTHNIEQHEEERATAMSDFPTSSTDTLANTEPGPDSSQDLRTSML